MKLNANEFSQLSKILILGVGDYKSPTLKKLDSPPSDALKLLHTLLKKDGCSIPELNIRSLSQSITKENFLLEFKKSIEHVKKDEIFIFYFAGHGTRLQDNFYICIAETDTSDLTRTAISSFEIDILLRNFIGRGILFILDCCESAGFAEFAPSSFRQLGNSDFRILLSSSKATQLSWELKNARGTIFTNILTAVLDGKESTGKESGLIYFSELYGHLQNRIAEEVNLNYDSLPEQTPVFTGAFTHDPLLFVHKNLTLRQLSVKTIKYSKAQINRIIKRSAILTLSLLFFLFGGYYTFLEKHQFVQEVEGRLIIYKGYPGQNGLGFPKKLWTLNLAPDETKLNSQLRIKHYIVSDLNKPVMPKLLVEVNSFKRIELLWLMNKKAEAQALLRQSLQGDNLKDPTELSLALKSLSELFELKDTALLKKLFSDPRSLIEVKRQALSVLAQIAPEIAFNLASQWKVNLIEDYYTNKSILLNVNEKATNGLLTEFINHIMESKPVQNVMPYVYKIAIERKIQINSKLLFNRALANDYADGTSMGQYLKIVHNDSLIRLLVNQLNQNGNKEYSTRFIISCLNAIDSIGSYCNLYSRHLKNFLHETFDAMLAHCNDFNIDLLKNNSLLNKISHDAYCIRELAKLKLINADSVIILYNNNKFANERDILVESLQYLKSEKVVRQLLSLSRYREQDIEPADRNRVMAIKVLRNISPEKFDLELLNDPWEDVKLESYFWYMKINPQKAIDSLLGLINGDNIRILTPVLSFYPPDKTTLNEIRKGISKSGFTRTNSACLIAMFGNVKEVVELLNDNDVDLRKQVGGYAVFNKDIHTIYSDLKNKIIYPNEQLLILRKQMQIKSKIDSYLKLRPVDDEKWARDLLFENYRDEMSDGLYNFWQVR